MRYNTRIKTEEVVVARFYTYDMKNPKRAVNMLSGDEWRGGIEIIVESDSAVLCIEMDKPWRSISLGVVQGWLLDEGWEMGRSVIEHQKGPDTFCFNRRLVAMVARLYSSDAARPEYGEEIPIPTEEEADAIYKELDIATPATNVDSDAIYCDSVPVGDDGEPV